MTKKPRPKNAQDSTLRNVRASQKRVAELIGRIDAHEQRLQALEARLQSEPPVSQTEGQDAGEE